MQGERTKAKGTSEAADGCVKTNLAGEEEDESFAEWLSRYRVGRAGPSDETPSPPPAIRAILEGRDHSGGSGASSTSSRRPSHTNRLSATSTASVVSTSSSLPSLNSATAEALLEFYRQKGHFPAPPGPYEEERLRLAHKYGLDQPSRRKAIDRICALAKAYFKTSSVVISLTFDDYQVLGAERGFGPEEPPFDSPPRPLELPPAFCTHAMLASYRDPHAVFIVPDADRDWRFKGNPYSVDQGGGLSFYAAANVHLPVSLARRERGLPPTLASGALCLIDPTPRAAETFSAEERQVLTDFAEMISREFQLGFEQRRREVEAEQTLFIGRFLREALVLPCQPESLLLSSTSPASKGSKTSRPDPSRPSTSSGTARLSPMPAASTCDAPAESLFAVAARQLRTLTHAGSSAILDLRSFRPASASPRPLHHPKERSGQQHYMTANSSPNYSPAFTFSGQQAGNQRRVPSSTGANIVDGTERQDRGSIALMGCIGDVDWAEAFSSREKEEQLSQAIEETLQAYYEEATSSPETSSIDAEAFIHLGVIPADAAGASFVVPVLDSDGSPVILVVVTSGEKWFSFEPTDRQFAASVGAIVVSSLLRQRALEADKAKLHFVSQVSHELRTPLHGCTSQLELVREFASPLELRKLTPLLDAADVCLESLSDVLNDVLDFSKLDHAAAVSSPRDIAEMHRRALVQTDLSALVEGVAKSTWVRKQRVDLVSGDLSRSQQSTETAEKDQVDLLLEVEERKNGWLALIDVGGLKRVLFNVVGNALKFTRKGEVKIVLQDLGAIPPSSLITNDDIRTERRLAMLSVRDTGIGMSDDFVRSASYLLPFRQADPFVTGAGLGLSIVDTILKRMGGRLDVSSQLGVGTLMHMTIPLDFVQSAVSPSTDSSLPRLRTRNISSELRQSLHHSSANLLLPQPTTRSRSTSLSLPVNGTSTSLLSTTPALVQVDFDAAIAASPAFLSLPRPAHFQAAIRSQSPVPPLATRAGPDDLAVDAANLRPAIATADRASPIGSVSYPSTQTGSQPAVEQTKKQQVKVLVAEDNPIARNILVRLLSGKNIPFGAAEDGQEAVELFENGNGTFTLVLADVQMPRLDGIDASRAIRQLEAEQGWRRCKIIALTGLSNDADMQKALRDDGPIDRWLVKGGKSLRVILDEIANLQNELDEEEGVGSRA
ncbi:sensor histidine kinase/response regulator [Rhodotorula toruloides]|uniref:histidine kinase n=1 Tax=Rhodotorula toruloides TaxID=5286 RepID=A0A511KE03_RHOTO|nr:sensor histidine kinase/response regulator [Rhodotorula toruloides]